MPALTKPLILIALLACAGCAKPSDIGAARREHLLAGPHGWIDLTLHAPAAASAPASGAHPARDAKPPHPSATCRIQFDVNGEPMLGDSVDLAQADDAGNPIGYRFPVPAGSLKTALAVDGCIPGPLMVKLPVTLDKDQLALIEFDGQALVPKATQAYAPATLDTVHGVVDRLHERGQATDATLTALTRLVIASIALNLVVVALLFLRRRRR